MKTLYIGGQGHKKTSGSNWKIYFCLILFVAILVSTLKLTGSFIAEKWINRKGAEAIGYAYSVRDVELSFGKGQIMLKDVKVFNPTTSAKILEAPNLVLQINYTDLLYQDKKVSVSADQVDLSISKDLASEIERIKAAGDKHKNDFFLDSVDGKFTKLNIIEQKEDQSRTMLELNNVNLKIKEVSLTSINKKTEFSINSNITDGGMLNLSGKTREENGKTPWVVKGSLKQVPSDLFNNIAGDKLPFAFNESRLNAEITAQSENGKVSGEISPEIRKLNLVQEKPGIPTQTIARILTDELTFTLPFTLKDELTLEYVDTFQKLKTYRKGAPAADESQKFAKLPVSMAPKTAKTKKTFSFWPF